MNACLIVSRLFRDCFELFFKKTLAAYYLLLLLAMSIRFFIAPFIKMQRGLRGSTEVFLSLSRPKGALSWEGGLNEAQCILLLYSIIHINNAIIAL